MKRDRELFFSKAIMEFIDEIYRQGPNFLNLETLVTSIII